MYAQDEAPRPGIDPAFSLTGKDMRYCQRLLSIGLVCGVTGAVAHSAAAADWTKFTDCANQSGSIVEQVEPSLFDGSRLIVDALCQSEAAELANKLVSENPNTVRDHGGFAGAFDTYMSVIRREVTKVLFERRRKRLGI